ncbi:MAG: hypothetical protein LBC48_04580 [Dysgonamonadaceae bacterium]|nr:hypothetical protein [Dysgonamonadaceae bacterium]
MFKLSSEGGIESNTGREVVLHKACPGLGLKPPLPGVFDISDLFLYAIVYQGFIKLPVITMVIVPTSLKRASNQEGIE